MPDAVLQPHVAATPRQKTECPANVRLARSEDAASLLSLIHLMHQENGFGPFCQAKVHAVLERGTSAPTAGQIKPIVGVIEDENGSIVASVCLVAGVWWYTDDDHWHLEDLWLYVHPDARSSKTADHAATLIDFAKWAADGIGIPLLLGILTRSRVEAKTRLYSRRVAWRGGLFFYDPADAP